VLRASLESLAAYLAAERLDAKSAEKISEVSKQMKSAVTDNYLEWFYLELNFHRAVWETAQNDGLFRHLDQLSVPMYAMSTMHYFTADLGTDEILETARVREETDHVQGHQPLARAILSGNPEAARESAVLHIM